LGLTMACAQCHDHKYDPVTMRDYYGLLDAFNRVPESGTPSRQSARIRIAAPFLELPTEEKKVRIKKFEAKIAQAEAEGKQIGDKAYEAWRSKLHDRNSVEHKNLPAALAKIMDKADADRSDAEKKSHEP